MTRAPLTPEHKAKISASNLGRTRTPEHRAKISEGVRRACAEGRGRWWYLRRLTEAERADHLTLMNKGGFKSVEALAMIGRLDLIREGRA